ncbi:ZBT40 protein, partial [Sylvia borin]|nr:ZBT40 protein [Sylvia borin]
MYSDKLPLGKHNFTKVTSVADSLQMFDVGVSCKNLLRDLISCSALTVVRGVSSQEADSSGNQAEPNYLSQSGRPDEEKNIYYPYSESFSFTWPYRNRNGRRYFSSWPGIYCESYLAS